MKNREETRLLLIYTISLVLLLLSLSASGRAQTVVLEWDPNSESDLAGYNIYRSNQSGSGYVKQNISLITETTYEDSTVQVGQTYYYVCTAVNETGLESDYSNEVMTTIVMPGSPPEAVDDVVSTSEDTAAAFQVLSNDQDADGDDLTITGVSQGQFGQVYNNGTYVTYVPNPEFFGQDVFTYTVSDPSGFTDTATVVVTVNAVNDYPVVENDVASTEEDKAAWVNVVKNDTDPDGDYLALASFTQGAHGTVVRNSDQVVKYKPVKDFYGTDSFNYTITDGNGGEATGTVTIHISAVNDPPSATNDSASTEEGKPVWVNVVKNDVDPDGDKLTLASFTQGAHGTVVRNSDQVVKYKPAKDFHGTDSFNYTITDNNGGEATGTVTIQVTVTNNPPVAVDDTGSTDEDKPVWINVINNDTDPDGDSLEIESFTQGAHGTVVQNSAQVLKYTPNPNYNGPDSFTYLAADGKGGTATGTVNIQILAVNDEPVAVDDTGSTDEDKTLWINVIKNDTDPDGDNLTLESIIQGAHGKAIRHSDKVIKYIPHKDYFGSDSVGYTVVDGEGAVAQGTVSISILPVNDLPAVQADVVETKEGKPIVVDILANDSDVDGDILTLTGFAQADYGVVSLVESEERVLINYQPKDGFLGVDSFTYRVSDGSGEVEGRVTVQVVDPRLYFPVTFETGESLMTGTYVGVGLLNSKNQTEQVNLTSYNLVGEMVSSSELPGELAPMGQEAFLTGEVSEFSYESVTFSARGQKGDLQGFFMVGDSKSRRLDGFGATPDAGKEIYFIGVEEKAQTVTMLQMLNRGWEQDARMTMELYSPEGERIKTVKPVLPPGGSFTGSLADIFGLESPIEEGYVKVVSDTAVSGYGVKASPSSFSAVAGQIAQPTEKLLSPHFFVDSSGFDTSLRILNIEDTPRTATLRCLNDAGEPVAETEVVLNPGQLTILSGREILEQNGIPLSDAVSGYLELETSDPVRTRLATSISYNSPGKKAATTVPMLAQSYRETTIAQVAQTLDDSLYTGLVIVNPNPEPVRVMIEAYGADGILRREKALDIPAHSRLIDMLRSETFFGLDYEQVKGHVRIRSDQKLFTYAAFGDSKGQFMATIEGQKAE